MENEIHSKMFHEKCNRLAAKNLYKPPKSSVSWKKYNVVQYYLIIALKRKYNAQLYIQQMQSVYKWFVE